MLFLTYYLAARKLRFNELYLLPAQKPEKLSVCYKLPKAKYKDFEAVKDFIANELKGEVK